eukprot:SAG25_NODE_2369_length_1675_cov_1.162437_2_plen_78_part_01
MAPTVFCVIRLSQSATVCSEGSDCAYCFLCDTVGPQCHCLFCGQRLRLLFRSSSMSIATEVACLLRRDGLLAYAEAVW